MPSICRRDECIANDLEKWLIEKFELVIEDINFKISHLRERIDDLEKKATTIPKPELIDEKPDDEENIEKSAEIGEKPITNELDEESESVKEELQPEPTDENPVEIGDIILNDIKKGAYKGTRGYQEFNRGQVQRVIQKLQDRGFIKRIGKSKFIFLNNQATKKLPVAEEK